MLRKELVEKLEKVSPALAGNDLIPVLTHFCFAEGEVIAHNDQIAISTVCKAGLDGCVRGTTLLAWVNASLAKNIDFKDGTSKKDEKEIVFVAASSKLRLPCTDVEEFDEIFTMPKASDKYELPVDPTRFLEAIDCCMRSVSIDTSVPDQLGITLIVDGKTLLMYATDNSTLSHVRLPLKGKVQFDRAILSGPFCRELLTLGKGSKGLHLEVRDDYSLLVTPAFTLHGKLIQSDKPVDFADAFDRSFPEAAEKKLVAVPTKLEGIIQRACIVAEANVTAIRTTISVEKGVAQFATITDGRGEAYDRLELEGKHPDVELAVDPKLLRKGYGAFDKMVMTEQCFVMANKDSYFLIGT